MSGRYALIIGNTEYTDPGLARLYSPAQDAADFARVLKDKEIGAFDKVEVALNEPAASVVEAIDEFFDQKKPDDLLVLYFSGHGIRDEFGSLYLAFKNTNRSRLRSTAIRSDYIREAMDQSRSRRQVLILDCCNSGAFPQGTKAELGGSMGLTQAFQGYGRFILTASDATQFAWDGDTVTGEIKNSLFTHFLIKGLEGEADSDGDGKISVDELYEYAFEEVAKVTPTQTPTKSATRVAGEIVLRQITRITDIPAQPLPNELIEASEDSRAFVRESAVQQLQKYIQGRNLGLARSARSILERMEKEDDSRRVSQAATQALAPIRKLEEAQREPAATTNPGVEPQVLPASTHGEVKQGPVPETTSGTSNAEVLRDVALQIRSIWAGIIHTLQDRLNSLRSVFPSRPNAKTLRAEYFVLGGIALTTFILFSWSQLVYLTSNSVSHRVDIHNFSPKVRIMDTINYEATGIFLKGMRFQIEIETNRALKDQLLEVIVFFQYPEGHFLAMPRSFTNWISPYISDQGYISVYKDFTPEFEYDTTTVDFFVPYAILQSGEVPAGKSEVTYFASLFQRTGDGYSHLTDSAKLRFTYEKSKVVNQK